MFVVVLDRAVNHVQPTRELDTPAERAAKLLARLQHLGLTRAVGCVLTLNRSTMVSMYGSSLRVHESFCDAPYPVLRAIVDFFMSRDRYSRRAARTIIIGHAAPVIGPSAPRQRKTAADDSDMAHRLAECHALLNERHFEGQLKSLQPHVSRRMRSRLGHYSSANEKSGSEAEIVISRRHIRRDGFKRALDTLLHEMVHQWQDENGLPLDHGKHFRKKAREVGTAPFARRPRDISLSG